MSWINQGRAATSPARVHGAVASRAPTVQAAKRSVNAATATDSAVHEDVMSMHRVPSRRSSDPAKLDGLRASDLGDRQGLEEIFGMRLRPCSDSSRTVLERGWETSASRVVRSVNKRNRRIRRSSCPARSALNGPRKAAGFLAADAFLGFLEDEIAAAERAGCVSHSQSLRP